MLKLINVGSMTLLIILFFISSYCYTAESLKTNNIIHIASNVTNSSVSNTTTILPFDNNVLLMIMSLPITTNVTIDPTITLYLSNNTMSVNGSTNNNNYTTIGNGDFCNDILLLPPPNITSHSSSSSSTGISRTSISSQPHSSSSSSLIFSSSIGISSSMTSSLYSSSSSINWNPNSNIETLSIPYLVANSLILEWTYIPNTVIPITGTTNIQYNTTSVNNVVTISTFLVTNPAMSVRFLNLQPMSRLNFSVNNSLVLSVLLPAISAPFALLGLGTMLNTSLSIPQSGTWTILTDVDAMMSSNIGTVFQDSEVPTGLRPGVFLYNVLTIADNFVLNLKINNVNTSNGNVGYYQGLTYTTSLTNTSASSLCTYGLFSRDGYLNTFGQYSTFPLFISFSKVGSVINVYSSYDNDNYLDESFTCDVSTINQSLSVYAGVFLSGIGAMTNISASMILGPPLNIKTLNSSELQVDYFMGYDPSNNYHSEYFLTWLGSIGASYYNIYYSMASLPSMITLATNIINPYFLMGTFSALYNYSVWIVPMNAFGSGTPFLVNLTSNINTTTVAEQTPLALPFPTRSITSLTNNFQCGQVGVDYMAFNSFGHYLWTVPSQNCSQQWVQVVGGSGAWSQNHLLSGSPGQVVTALLNLTTGQTYSLVIGESGFYVAYPYAGGCPGNNGGGSGGGFSGIFTYNNISSEAAYLMSGGGGGSGPYTSTNGSSNLYTCFDTVHSVTFQQSNIPQKSIPQNPFALRSTSCGFALNSGGSGGGYWNGLLTYYCPGGNGYNYIASVSPDPTIPPPQVLSGFPSCADPNQLDGSILISCVIPSQSSQIQSILNMAISQGLNQNILNNVTLTLNATQEQVLNGSTLCSLTKHKIMFPVPGQYVSPNGNGTCFVPTPAPVSLSPIITCPGNTTYYISLRDGRDTNPGTFPEQPFQTLGAMELLGNTLLPGDQILLCRGDHHFAEFLSLQLPYGTTYQSSFATIPNQCTIHIGSYTCNPQYSNELPALYGSIVLPQFSDSDPHWNLTLHTLLNGTTIQVLSYDMTSIDRLTGTYYMQSVETNGVAALWVNNIRYQLARHPNLQVINGNYSATGLYGSSFNELYESDTFSNYPTAPPSPGNIRSFFSAGSWCHHIWHDLFGENTALMTQTFQYGFSVPGGPNQTYFSDAYISIPGWFWFLYALVGNNAFTPGTIDCPTWYAKYVVPMWGTQVTYDSDNAYLLDALTLTNQDAQNSSFWWPGYIYPIDNRANSVQSPYGPYSGVPTLDANNNVNNPAAPPTNRTQTVSGNWGYGQPLWFTGPCYLLDMPGEYCVSGNTLYVIPLNAQHLQQMLSTQPTLPLPLTPSLVGMNRSAVSTYILATYAPPIISNGFGCPIQAPNWDISDLEVAYGTNGMSIYIWNFVMHHVIFHDFMSQGIQITSNTDVNTNIYNTCALGIVNPRVNITDSSSIIHNIILYNVMTYSLTLSTNNIQLALNNTLYYGNGNTAGSITLNPFGALGNNIGLESYVRGNYIYNSGAGFSNNLNYVEDYTFLDTFQNRTQYNLAQFNIVNFTNTELGSYSTVTWAGGIMQGNIINNTMDGFFFTERVNSQNGAIYMFSLYATFCDNICESSYAGLGGPTLLANYQYSPSYEANGTVTCVPNGYINLTRNIIIDDYLQLLYGVFYPTPGGDQICNPSYLVTNNSQFFIHAFPNDNGEIGQYPYPGSNWILGFGTVDINTNLSYTYQPDYDTKQLYSYRQSLITDFRTPPFHLTQEFVEQDRTMDLFSSTHTFLFSNVLQNQLDDFPYLSYGAERVSQIKEQAVATKILEMCRLQDATESWYTNYSTMGLSNHYHPPRCWPPIYPMQFWNSSAPLYPTTWNFTLAANYPTLLQIAMPLLSNYTNLVNNTAIPTLPNSGTTFSQRGLTFINGEVTFPSLSIGSVTETGSFTFSLWYQIDQFFNLGGNPFTVALIGGHTYDANTVIISVNPSYYMTIQIGAFVGCSHFLPNFNFSSWRHVTFSFDSSTLLAILYDNGQIICIFTHPYFLDLNPVDLGYADNVSFGFYGVMTCFGIWSRTLTANQVISLYQQQTNSSCLTLLQWT